MQIRFRQFLQDAAITGMCNDGGPLAGMAGSFQIRPDEIPHRWASGDPDDEIGRGLPEAIIAQLLPPSNLELLAPVWQRLGRLAIDSGRRPEELCGLTFNCLGQDLVVGDDGHQQNLPVLIHDQPKVKLTGVRRPLTAETAKIIIEQQAAILAEHPDATDPLSLFPARP